MHPAWRTGAVRWQDWQFGQRPGEKTAKDLSCGASMPLARDALSLSRPLNGRTCRPDRPGTAVQRHGHSWLRSPLMPAAALEPQRGDGRLRHFLEASRMRIAAPQTIHRRHLRRLAFRRWQASHAEHGEATPPTTADEDQATPPRAWPEHAVRAVADNVRAHPIAWLLGAAGVGAGCALLATLAGRARARAQPAERSASEGVAEEDLALACRMDCAPHPAGGLPPLQLGVQVSVTLVPLSPPV
jgi:hypothetical protein